MPRGVSSNSCRRRNASSEPSIKLATVKDLEFSSGVIEVELAGMPAPDAPPGARGFAGANGRGGVALWMDNGTVAHFRTLRVTLH
jgi:hypothetical protein